MSSKGLTLFLIQADVVTPEKVLHLGTNFWYLVSVGEGCQLWSSGAGGAWETEVSHELLTNYNAPKP